MGWKTGTVRLYSRVLVDHGLYSSVLDDGVWWVAMSGFCQSQVHIAAAAVTLLLSQDGREEDDADTDVWDVDVVDDHGDADGTDLFLYWSAPETLLLIHDQVVGQEDEPGGDFHFWGIEVTI